MSSLIKASPAMASPAALQDDTDHQQQYEQAKRTDRAAAATAAMSDLGDYNNSQKSLMFRRSASTRAADSTTYYNNISAQPNYLTKSKSVSSARADALKLDMTDPQNLIPIAKLQSCTEMQQLQTVKKCGSTRGVAPPSPAIAGRNSFSGFNIPTAHYRAAAAMASAASAAPISVSSKWESAERWLVNVVSPSRSQCSSSPSPAPTIRGYNPSANTQLVSNDGIKYAMKPCPAPAPASAQRKSSKLNVKQTLDESRLRRAGEEFQEEDPGTVSDSEINQDAAQQEQIDYCSVLPRSRSHRVQQVQSQQSANGGYGGMNGNRAINHRSIKNQLVAHRKRIMALSGAAALSYSSGGSLRDQTDTETIEEEEEEGEDAAEARDSNVATKQSAAADPRNAEPGRSSARAVMVVQTPRSVNVNNDYNYGALHGPAMASMRDASTDVSPNKAWSPAHNNMTQHETSGHQKRDMGTQITPAASSKSSPRRNSSATPAATPTATAAEARAASPARHNTPVPVHVSGAEDPNRQPSSTSDSSTFSLISSCSSSSSSWKSLQGIGASAAANSHNHNNSDHHHQHQQHFLKNAVASPAKPLFSACGGGAFPIEPPSPATSVASASVRDGDGDIRNAFNMSKIAREEARIDAWENHQKAKAEAEMKKLEVKLEKLRSQATERIMNKLASAHLKAEEMRAAARAQQAAKVLERSNSLQKKLMGAAGSSLGVCFSSLLS